MAKFSFQTLDYSLWGSKNRYRLKKFMQVEVDVKCMETEFGGCEIPGFGEIATFHIRPNFHFELWIIVHGG